MDFLTTHFLELVNLSISASYLVLAVVLLRPLLKKVPKWITCALWALVAVRLLYPVSIESVFSLIPTSIGSGELIQELSDDYVGSTQIYYVHTPQYQDAVDAGLKPIHSEDGPSYVVTDGDNHLQPPATVETAVIPVLCAIWILGMGVMAVFTTGSYLRLRRQVSPSLLVRDNIYLCDYIGSPFILGLFRPRIYLPSALDQSQWPHVIAHEQAHLARRDHWWKPLGFALLCLHWFNPVLWLAYVLLCKDIELACDERVIRDMDTQEKKAYSEALLECSMPRYLIAACPLAFGEVGVKERVKSVLNYKKPAFWIILMAVVASIAVAVCFLTDPIDSNTPNTGIILSARNVNPSGITVDCTQSGGTVPGPFTYGNDYYLQRLTEDGWVYVPNLDGTYSSTVTTEAYSLPPNGSASWTFNWTDRFGSLEPGLYRFVRYFSSGSTTDNNTSLPSYAVFCIPEETASPTIPGTCLFFATVLEVNDGSILVMPLPGTLNHPGVDQLWVSRTLADSGETIQGIAVGDIVSIVFDGKIADTYPAQINGTISIEVLPNIETRSRTYILEQAVLDGCVVMIDGDVAANQQVWHAFVEKVNNGQSAQVRYVTYYTIGDPDRMSPELFEESRSRYPVMYIHDLTYDGQTFTLRWFEGEKEYVQNWKYLMHYTGTPESPYAVFEAYDCYMLTDRNDVTYENLWNGMYSADFRDQIPFHQVYIDRTYPNEPTFQELEAAKDALTPYMLEYSIATLDANELTNRLDIQVREWVDGLFDLIKQYIDPNFVTVTELKGELALTE